MEADTAITAEVTTVAQGQLGDVEDARAHRLALVEEVTEKLALISHFKLF